MQILIPGSVRDGIDRMINRPKQKPFSTYLLGPTAVDRLLNYLFSLKLALKFPIICDNLMF